MKILYVINSLYAGGAEKMVFNLLNSEVFSEDEFLIVTLLEGGILNERIQKLGFRVLSLNVTRSPLALYHLSKIINDFEPDIIQSWLYQSDIIAGIVCKLQNRDIIWSIRQSNLSKEMNSLSSRFFMRLCAFFSKTFPEIIISNSDSGRLEHVKIGYEDNKIVVIPNGFNIAEFNPNDKMRANFRNSIGVKREQIIVGFVGRFDIQKNYEGLLKVVNLVVSKLPSIVFCFAGKNVTYENPDFFRLSQENNINENNLILLGERTDIPNVMSGFDVFVLPSKGEAFPNALGEAMSMSIPCVSNDVGDCKKIIADCGVVLSDFDPSSFADAIIRLANDKSEKRRSLGEKARRRIVENYSLEDSAKSFRLTYINLANKRNGGL